MIKKEGQVSRKTVKEDRIAICPQFGCTHLKKVKPLKFGFLGFRKYPKCSKHKFPLVFVDEFIGNFLHAVNACLFDTSSLPPEDLISLIKTCAPESLKSFVNGWMYCNPIGRGAQIVSNYMDGLSRGYMKLLSRKQKKALQNEKRSKNRYQMLRKGLEKIAEEYTTFLQELREKSDTFYDPIKLHPLSDEVRKLLKIWLKGHLNEIRKISRKYRSESPTENEPLPVFKEVYDKILHAGTCTLLLGKFPAIIAKGVSPFELFSAYYEFLKAGLCRELKRVDVKSLLEEFEDTERAIGDDFDNATRNDWSLEKFQTDISAKKEVYNKEDVDNSTTDTINSDEQKLTKNTHTSFPLKISNFKQRLMKEIRRLVPLLEATDNQKELILEKAEDILDKHISRAIKGEITIHKDENPLTNAAAIIYAVLVSDDNMPKINATKLSEIIGVSQSVISILYNRWYKDFVRKSYFDFRSAQVGRIRNITSLYFFERLLITEIELSKLILSLGEINISKIVLRLREIIINANKEHSLLRQFTEREIETLQDMANNYPDTFTKYFSDLVSIVKLLIISIKSHKTIGADFSALDFAKFLMDKGIDLFLAEIRLARVIRGIFKFLKNTNYFSLFPTQMQSEYRPDAERVTVVGSRIKLYVMKHIYNGKYFVNSDGIAACPECLREGFTVNISLPRISSKEFHHEDARLEGYTIEELYRLFTNDRGNPYFLRDLINKMESESVGLLCSSHHQLIVSTNFNNFKKLISWENIPFPYKDIFDLPAEIIHLLAMICVEYFPLLEPLAGKPRTRKFIEERKRNIKSNILYHLKRKYIIDRIYGGVCPACGEFNTKDYLPTFEYCHLYELNEITPEERERRNDLRRLIESHPCSEIVKILERQEGGYVCRNCHRVIHKNISNIHKIYDDQNLIRKARRDYEKTIHRYKQNLIRGRSSFDNPLKIENRNLKSLMEYLFILFEISEEKSVVSSTDLANKMGRDLSNINRFFSARKKLLEKYGKIIVGKVYSPTRYYMNDEGKRIVRLLYYFRDYYRNYRR